MKLDPYITSIASKPKSSQCQLRNDIMGLYDTCTLPGTMVESGHEAFDKWGPSSHTPSIVFRL